MRLSCIKRTRSERSEVLREHSLVVSCELDSLTLATSPAFPSLALVAARIKMKHSESDVWSFNLHDDEATSSASEEETDSQAQLRKAQKTTEDSRRSVVTPSKPFIGGSSSTSRPVRAQEQPERVRESSSRPVKQQVAPSQPSRKLKRVHGTVEDSERDRKRRQVSTERSEGRERLGDTAAAARGEC